MKLGLFMMPLHPPARPLHEICAEDADKIIYADSLGFDEAWVGEHFSAATEQISSPLMFMATLLHQTQRISFGTGVIGLPNHHPAIVAAEVALFDQMSRGRFMFGIGPTGLSSDHELFGNSDPVVRGERLMELIDIILRIWAQDPPYDIVGKHWQVRITDSVVPSLGVGFLSKPYQTPHPPISMSAMSPNSESVATAASRGWGVISANFAPEYTLASHWRKYLLGCAASGREPDGRQWRVARNVIVGESDQQALDWAMDPKGSNHYYFSYLWEVLQRANYTIVMRPDPAMANAPFGIEDMIDSMVVHGSARTVTEKLSAMRERVGPFGTLLMASMDGTGVNHSREWSTMRSLATEVVPALCERTAV